MYRSVCLWGLFAVISLQAADNSSPSKDAANIFIGSVLAQVAVGAAWSTEIQVMHSRFNDIPETFTVRFHNEAGQDLALPVVGIGTVTSVSGVLQPRGVTFFQLEGGATTKVGFASIETILPGGATMNAILTQRIEGRPDFQASVPSMDVAGTNFQFPFRNDGAFTTTMALVSRADQLVTSIARDVNGVELCRTTWEMNAGEHISLLISDLLPCTADARGVLEVVPDEGGTMIAFLFNDFGAFTTQLPFEIVADE